MPGLQLRWPGLRKVRRTVCRRVGRRIRELGLSGPSAYRALARPSRPVSGERGLRGARRPARRRLLVLRRRVRAPPRVPERCDVPRRRHPAGAPRRAVRRDPLPEPGPHRTSPPPSSGASCAACGHGSCPGIPGRGHPRASAGGHGGAARAGGRRAAIHRRPRAAAGAGGVRAARGIGPLPREIGLLPPHVAVGGRRTVDRPPEVERLHDGPRPQLEPLPHPSLDVPDRAAARCRSTPRPPRSGSPTRSRRPPAPRSARQAGADQFLAAHAPLRAGAVNLRGVLAAQRAAPVPRRAAIGVHRRLPSGEAPVRAQTSEVEGARRVDVRRDALPPARPARGPGAPTAAGPPPAPARAALPGGAAADSTVTWHLPSGPSSGSSSCRTSASRRQPDARK